MKTDWLIRQNNKSLLVFFNGWGQNARPFEPFKGEGHDVFMFWDYRNPPESFSWPEEFDSYERITLVAWSMGAWFANYYFSPFADKIQQKIAVNGTLHPIDDQFGIPEKIFAGTYLTLNDQNLGKFNKRMFYGSAGEELYSDHSPKRPIEEVKEELKSIADFCSSNHAGDNLFDLAVISEQDRIFPFKNLKTFWKDKIQTKTISQAHFPFYQWSGWDDLLQSVNVSAE